MTKAAYQLTGADPVLRGEALEQLLAELVGDDDRTLAVEEFTVPGRAAPGEAESDAPSGAEGREEAVRAYGKQIEEAIAGSPDVLAPLRLHYLRWVLFDVGSGLHFQYQGIFDTDFDKYTEDAVALFSATGITTVFTNLEGFPEDWKENPDAFVQFVREHQCSSFLEYGEYPYVTADEIKKALRLKAAFSDMLDQMQ